MSKKMVYIYSTEQTVHQFAICYMINPSLHINKIFKTQVETLLGCFFSIKTMQTIKKNLMKKNTSFVALVIIYETVGISIKKVYIVSSCVFNNIIDKYVCIDYL